MTNKDNRYGTPWENSQGVQISDKKSLTKHFYTLLLNRVIDMFEWENLPNTIDKQILNLYLFVNGRTCITDFNGKLYATFGNYGGEPNAYYLPTKFIIANPVLGTKEVTNNENGVIIFNSDSDKYPYSSNYGGLYGIITFTANMLAETILTMSTALKNARVQQILKCNDEAQKMSAEQTLKEIFDGKPYLMVSDNMLNSICSIDRGQGLAKSVLMETVETFQFWLANFYHSIGINSNYNMKRERLTDDEINVNNSALLVNIGNMLTNRQIAVEKINEIYGTDIKVNFSKNWKIEDDVIEGDENEAISDSEHME